MNNCRNPFDNFYKKIAIMHFSLYTKYRNWIIINGSKSYWHSQNRFSYQHSHQQHRVSRMPCITLSPSSSRMYYYIDCKIIFTSSSSFRHRRKSKVIPSCVMRWCWKVRSLLSEKNLFTSRYFRNFNDFDKDRYRYKFSICCLGYFTIWNCDCLLSSLLFRF